MISILFSLILLGSFLSYSTSTKVNLSENSALDVRLNNAFKFKNQLGWMIVFISILSFTLILGFTSGILIGLFIYAISISLLVCIYPLHIVKTKIVVLFIFISIISEFILNYAS
ncbi:hypothetical protein [uncultured Tenacibaculum sp.]|uniref:hypothetical protein n=1 Tax=uncultured Tenacibaculum sp. TaxID=174713 RepID=UPI00262AE68C|nr:hypothetical protein [uncultured Tenacibaculum sp.]